jgi:hypothetical protein
MRLTSLLPFLLLALTSTIKALGCYSHGLTWSDLGQYDKANGFYNFGSIEAACRVLAGTYTPGTGKTYCSSVGSAHVAFEMWNLNSARTQSISYGQCLLDFEREMRAWSHGSEQDYGPWWVRIDPNSGKC